VEGRAPSPVQPSEARQGFFSRQRKLASLCSSPPPLIPTLAERHRHG